MGCLQIHLLDPELAECVIDNDIKDPNEGPGRYSALYGKLLEFGTEARPAKRSLAFHAQVLLHFGRRNKWAAAEVLRVPWELDPFAASFLRERNLIDLSMLVGPPSSDSGAS